MSSTRTRYARSGNLDIAYQVLGGEPPDLLQSVAGFIPIDCMDEEPSLARFQRRLASYGRPEVGAGRAATRRPPR